MTGAECVGVAALVVLALLILARVPRRKGARDKFASERAQETCRISRELFSREGGPPTYSSFKTALPGTDPVVYTDARRLWQEGRLTPEEVQKIL